MDYIRVDLRSFAADLSARFSLFWLFLCVSVPLAKRVVPLAFVFPTERVVVVFQGGGGFGQAQGPEGIDHDRQFFGTCLSQAGLDRAGLGAVRQAGRVQRDGTLLYSAPAGG